MRQLPDAALGLQLLGGFRFQRLHRAAQLQCAGLHQVFKLGACLHQRSFGRFSRADVLRNPDRALIGVGHIHQLGMHFAANRRAVFFAQHDLALKRLAYRKRCRKALPGLNPVLIRPIPAPRGAAQQLTGFVAKQFFEAAVALRHLAIPQKNNAHHGVVQNQVLLRQQILQLHLVVFLRADVLHDPDRTFIHHIRVDQLARQMRPEQIAIAPSHQHLGLESLAQRHHRVSSLAQRVKGGFAGVQRLAGVPYGPGCAGEAENLGKTVVATKHRALADEDNAHPSVVQHHLLVAQSAPQPGVGVDLCVNVGV